MNRSVVEASVEKGRVLGVDIIGNCPLGGNDTITEALVCEFAERAVPADEAMLDRAAIPVV